MKWSTIELRRYQDEPLNFSDTMDVGESLKQRDSEILAVAPVKVTGILSVGKKEYILHYRLTTTVTVPSSRSLEPVDMSLDLSVDEIFMTQAQWSEQVDDREEEIIVLDSDIIDLTDSVEDNILLAIPLQVLTDEEKDGKNLPKGNDWQVVSEEEYLAKKVQAETNDPRLAKLSELFNERDN
ncbi:YceD family protein [Enterococcus sp. AZ109]|uniref:YceD family protein n=1 Tax=Enterococcus sp. AZ109 TaxID=2774634 RepID=UPI003F213CEA